MTSLFASPPAKRVKRESSASRTIELPPESTTNNASQSLPLSFQDAGLKDWLCDVCRAMGFKRPFPIQQHCIPAILKRHDVMGCAETGSGRYLSSCAPNTIYPYMDMYVCVN